MRVRFISRFNVQSFNEQWASNIRPEYQVYFLYLQTDFPLVLISFEYIFNIPHLNSTKLKKEHRFIAKEWHYHLKKFQFCSFFFRILHFFSLTTLLHWRLTQIFMYAFSIFHIHTSFPFNLDLSTQFFFSSPFSPQMQFLFYSDFFSEKNRSIKCAGEFGDEKKIQDITLHSTQSVCICALSNGPSK